LTYREEFRDKVHLSEDQARKLIDDLEFATINEMTNSNNLIETNLNETKNTLNAKILNIKDSMVHQLNVVEDVIRDEIEDGNTVRNSLDYLISNNTDGLIYSLNQTSDDIIRTLDVKHSEIVARLEELDANSLKIFNSMDDPTVGYRAMLVSMDDKVNARITAVDTFVNDTMATSHDTILTLIDTKEDAIMNYIDTSETILKRAEDDSTD